MATARAASRPIPRIRSHIQHRRTFLSNPLSPSVQTLTATRVVPYAPPSVYTIISDIDSYSSFLPFCKTSEVTTWSNADKDGKKWPEKATLTIGLNDSISESFTSRVFCVPDQKVEALSGPDVESELNAESITHHRKPTADASDASRQGTVLDHLRTTWSLRHLPYKPGPLRSDANPVEETGNVPAQHHTEVKLAIEYKFANPLYAAMGAATAPKVAEYMVEAFEKRCKELLHKPSAIEGVDAKS